LILGGELDPITTTADLEDLAASIEGSRLELLPDTGHGLRNKPDEARAVVREFITRPSPIERPEQPERET
jgi:pimeloyl-ACP methyl ester carboxylesterase